MPRIIALLMLLLLGFVASGVRTSAQTVNQDGVTVPTLKEQLETGLLARTPAERAFVAKVVLLVNEGKLPNSLVQSTFLYARNRMPYPMPYFQRALKIRAKRAGIVL